MCRDIISQHGITHVINCVGSLCKEYFQGELEYLTYFLQGARLELWKQGTRSRVCRESSLA